MENLTIIIKTFERFYCIKRLVKSILKKYPDAKILIADDSKKSCKLFFENSVWKNNVTVYEMNPDCGLSAGRNYLLDKVQTKYFLLLDDDYVFDDKTDIDRAISILEEKKLDILGGWWRNFKVVKDLFSLLKVSLYSLIGHYTPTNYIGTILFDDNTKILTVNYITKQFPYYLDTDIVLNFFVGRTESVRERNRWDEELKLQEHTAFFFDAKKTGLKVGFSNEFSVQHRPIKLKTYSSFRGRDFTKIFMKKNGIKKIVATYDDKDVIVTELEA